MIVATVHFYKKGLFSSGKTVAGECSTATNSLCRRESRSHRYAGTRSDAGMERAAHILRGLPNADHHSNRQVTFLWDGAWSADVDGEHHLSDRNWGETKVRHMLGLLLSAYRKSLRCFNNIMHEGLRQVSWRAATVAAGAYYRYHTTSTNKW